MALTSALRGGLKPGGADLSLIVFLFDSTTGLPKTGVAFGSVTSYYYRQGAASAVQITMSSLAANNTAHSDGGWKEIDSTNVQGAYRIDVPDGFWATSADWVILNITSSGCDDVKLFFSLDVFNVDSSGKTLLQATQSGVTIPTVTTLTGHTAQTGDCYPIVNHATYGNARLVRSATPANTLAVDATGGVALGTGGIVSTTLDSTALDAISDALWLSSPATESYAADGAIPNLGQFLLMIMQRHNEFVKSGVTITVKKLDGSTTAATFTLDHATTPSNITRTS